MDDLRRYIAVGLSSGGIVVFSLQLDCGDSNDDSKSVSSIATRRPSTAPSVRAGSAANKSKAPESVSVQGNLVQRIFRRDATSELSDLKFDSTGTRLAAGSHDRHIYIYELIVGHNNSNVASYNLKLLHKLHGHSAYITHLDWSIDNLMLKSTCGAYELLFWDTETGRQVTNTTMNESWRTNTCVLGFNVMGIWPPGSDGTDVNALDVCKDNNLLATADDFGTLKVFQYPCIVKNAPGRVYGGHCSHVTNVRFYNDGSNNCSTKIATTGGNDNTVVVWNVRPIYQ